MVWEPDRRSNFFFSPPAHLCAVTYMTEISLIVTLNNQINSTQLKPLGPFIRKFYQKVISRTATPVSRVDWRKNYHEKFREDAPFQNFLDPHMNSTCIPYPTTCAENVI